MRSRKFSPKICDCSWDRLALRVISVSSSEIIIAKWKRDIIQLGCFRQCRIGTVSFLARWNRPGFTVSSDRVAHYCSCTANTNRNLVVLGATPWVYEPIISRPWLLSLRITKLHAIASFPEKFPETKLARLAYITHGREPSAFGRCFILADAAQLRGLWDFLRCLVTS